MERMEAMAEVAKEMLSYGTISIKPIWCEAVEKNNDRWFSALQRINRQTLTVLS